MHILVRILKKNLIIFYFNFEKLPEICVFTTFVMQNYDGALLQKGCPILVDLFHCNIIMAERVIF